MSRMLPHAAARSSVSRFTCPLRAPNESNETLKHTYRVPHLTTLLRTGSVVPQRRRGLRLVVHSESTKFSLGKDGPPSLRGYLEVKHEGDNYGPSNSGGGRAGLDNSFLKEFPELRADRKDSGAQALSLQVEVGEEFGQQHFKQVGRKYERVSSEEAQNLDETAEGEGDSQVVEFRTLVSAMGLIMGTAVGPGILGLPTATLPAGIQASTLMILGAWAYVTSSILLVAEISCAVMAERGEKEVSFTGLVEHTLGYNAARVVALVYASLNYALLVACVAGLGSILLGWLPMPAGLWSAASAAVVGLLVAFAPFKILDGFNRALCALMLVAITSLVASGVWAGRKVVVNSVSLPSFSLASVLSAVPLTVLTLGFHVITPVVCKIMKGRPQEARKAILLGGAVPLVMVLAWNGVILSLAGTHRSSALDPIKLLLSLNRSAAPAVQAFAFAALGTTLIGYAVSFPKQLADTAQIFSRAASQEVEKKEIEDAGGERIFTEVQPLLWALCPPTLAAILWSTAFASALDFAGVYANCFLFGILPPVMTWIHRYHQIKEDAGSPRNNQHLIPGGKLLLIVLFGISIFLGINPRT